MNVVAHIHAYGCKRFNMGEQREKNIRKISVEQPCKKDANKATLCMHIVTIFLIFCRRSRPSIP